MTTQDQPARGQHVRWRALADTAALRDAAYAHIVDAAAAAIRERQRFLLVLSGGTTPRAVYRELRAVDTDWSRWHIYFGVERCIPRDDPERNSVMAADAWLDHVSIPSSQRHVIAAELGATIGAREYARDLRDVGDFDLVLLGLGEDGHTASLFADHDWGASSDAADALAVVDAPKPPPQRVSLSATRLSRTRAALFLVAGESKRDAVKAWRAGADIPAAAIRPEAGVDALIDASLLTESIR
jgi:6-phosphogluconolactonase